MQHNQQKSPILAIVAITSFLGTFLISSINIALPAIEKEFSMHAVALSWVITGFLLTMATFLLPMGRIADLSGVKRIFKIGMYFFTISSLLCIFANSGTMLIVFRLIQGIGAALTSTTGTAILVAAYPPNQRGRVLGMSVASVYLGLATGPFIGGVLTETLGWRSVFVLSFVLGIVVVIVTQIFLGKDDSGSFKAIKQLRFRGSLFYIAGLGTLVFGSSRIPELSGWLLMLVGLVCFIIFWRSESKSEFPVFYTKLFTHNRLFAYSNLAALINYSSTYAIVFLLSLYLQKIKGMPAHMAGTILVAQPLVMAIFSPLAGRLSEKIQPRYLASSGMALCATGLIAFSSLSNNTPLWFIVAILIWMGLGFALFSSPNMNTIMSSVDRNSYAQASGTAGTMRVVGQIVSMTIATFFFALFMGKIPIEEASEGVFIMIINKAFLVFGLVALLGIYFSYSRGRLDRATAS